MAARIVAFIVWGLVAASAVFWGLRAGGAGPTAPAHTTAAPLFTPLQADLKRVLGGDSAAAPAAAPSRGGAAERGGLDAGRLKLLGVVTATPDRPAGASATSRDHLALIALDGRPARTFRTGAAVEGEMVVQAIEARRVHIGPRGGEPALTLELPAPAASASGSPGATPGTENARGGRIFGNTPSPAAAPSPAGPAPQAAAGSPATEDGAAPAEGEAESPSRPPRRTEPAVLRTPSPLTR